MIESVLYSNFKEAKKVMKKKKGTKPNKGIKCLGPVVDLEEQVQPDWWRYIFNSLYLKSDGDVVDDQEITKNEAAFFSKVLDLKPEDRILDLCCGQGRHSIELARQGFKNMEGFDRSRYLIQKAKKESAAYGLGIKFREGDARKLPYKTDSFDAVMILGNSFGYFDTPKDDFSVIKEVFRVLKPWGRILIDVADGEYLKENFQQRLWEWVDKKLFVCRERSLSSDKERLISREIITHTDKGVIVDQFYAERLYSKESLRELLENAGFKNTGFHGKILPDSQRNQDLGMMGNRIIVSAAAKKEWSSIRIVQKEPINNVAVVMGDPSKTDNMKPLGIFDDDDFYTINQLKTALSKIKGYRFIYIDNHDRLINDLIKLKPKIDFVLNLCDEGYRNSPTQELHVPALIEMLDIQYTGSNPQCLAYCYDKSLVRGIAREMDIPVPEGVLIKPEDIAFELPFKFPAIIKPNFGDSSFGITQRSVVNNMEELINAVSEIREHFGYDNPVLIEEFLTGGDLSIGIIGNPPNNYQILPIVEEDYSNLPNNLPRICGYEAKWQPDSPYWNNRSIPANLSEETERIIVDNSIKLCERLDVRDYCRLDWRLDYCGNPKLLEVNPNPGWCWDGHLAKMSNIAGISYSEMLKMILESAKYRFELKQTKNEQQITISDFAYEKINR